MTRGSIVALLVALAVSPLAAQRASNSAALKRYRPAEAPALVRPYDEGEKLWQDFLLVRNANGGDAEAQHELGLRHLFGEGFAPDTLKAALWIARAAAQRLPTACFNYGILLNNGWGVSWNPFAAHDQIAFAAAKGVSQAQYAYGLFLLDDLAVRRDEAEARCWVRAAADSAYAPAVELLQELDRRGVGISRTQNERRSGKREPAAASSASPGGLGLVFLDFNADTSVHTSDETLVQDLATTPADSGALPKAVPTASELAELDTAAVRSLEALAVAGNPDALTMLGRWLERKAAPDLIAATLAYARAIRAESPRAPELLWNLSRSPAYFETLRRAVDAGSADAAVAWATLVGLGFDHQLTDEQAFTMLAKAADAGHPIALVELGLCHLTGRWARQDRERALALWERAEERGSEDAFLRIASARLIAPGGVLPSEAMERLRRDASLGSTQAQLVLAYAEEAGRGTAQDVPAAVRAYRTLAQRGSRIAYESLRRMYDAVRPKDRPEFAPSR